MQLQGQAGVRYVIENSPDLISWSPFSTNTLAGSSVNLTNAINPATPQLFWRAAWVP